MRPVVWLGKISYSLYLWQQVFVFGEHPKAWYSVAFALAAACASHYLVEQPMLRMRELIVEQKAALAAAA